MDRIFNIKTALCGALGAFGGLLSQLMGGWTNDLGILVFLMALDFITGLLIAAMGKSLKSENGGLSSNVGWKGLVKKIMTLVLVAVAAQLDILIGTDFVRAMAIVAFIVNEVLSITENAGLLGLPLPAVFQKAIDILKGKADGNGKDEDK